MCRWHAVYMGGGRGVVRPPRPPGYGPDTYILKEHSYTKLSTFRGIKRSDSGAWGTYTSYSHTAWRLGIDTQYKYELTWRNVLNVYRLQPWQPSDKKTHKNLPALCISFQPSLVGHGIRRDCDSFSSLSALRLLQPLPELI